MKHLSRALGLVLVAFFAVSLMGASSCVQTADKAVGVDPTTGVQTTPVAQSPAGQAVAVAGGVASAALPGTGTLISLGLNVVLGAFAGIMGLLTKKANGQATTAQTALGIANTAISATAAGLQQAVNVLPAPHAATVAKILDVAHDAAGVVGALQDQIQPNLSTAGSHAAAPAPAVAAA
jgi:hypothetical protein